MINENAVILIGVMAILVVGTLVFSVYLIASRIKR